MTTSRSPRSADYPTFASAVHRHGAPTLYLLYVIAFGSAIALHTMHETLMQESTGGIRVLMNGLMALHAVLCATGVVLFLTWTAGMTIRDKTCTSDHVTAHQSLLGLLRSRVEQHTDWLYRQVVLVVPALLLVCAGVLILVTLINNALTHYASPSELSRAMVRWMVWFMTVFAIICEAAGVWVMYTMANRNTEVYGTMSAQEARRLGVTLVTSPALDVRRGVRLWQLRALLANILLTVFVITVL